MFKSIFHIPNSIKYNKAKNIYSSKYQIIDDDFETVVVPNAVWIAGGDVTARELGVEIINCYENRGLNVVANFILYMQYCQKRYDYSINHLLKLQENHNPKFSKYKEDIQKLLVLI